MTLEAICFDKHDPSNVVVKVLDQLLLPYLTKYIEIHTIDDGFTVIKNMQVRGAPAIAIVGVLSVLVEVQMLQKEHFTKTQWYYDLNNWASTRTTLNKRLAFLLSSRPTAVNLANALNRVKELLQTSDSLKTFDQQLYHFVVQLMDDDLSNNIKLGDNGAKFLLNALAEEGFDKDFAVLTICNTGSLATSGYGTALGVIRSLWKDSQAKSSLLHTTKKLKPLSSCKMVHAFPLETRPYNQGSRLTAYELVHDQIPATLITDSMVSYKIKTSTIPIKAAFAGADRIVRNGDTANKIGTFQLAILCKQFGIKFFVVAPKTTIDNKTKTGDDIVVEQRNGDEMRIVTGTKMDYDANTVCSDQNKQPIAAKVGIAPPQIDVWNPAFDITPHELIDGIVTEEGVFTKDAEGNFHLEQLF